MAEEPAVEASTRHAAVSVVVPTYQGAGHVRACLESLAAQTLAPSDFEVLVVLNGPSDGTRDVVASVCREHPALDVRVLRTALPGAGHARNAGLEAARGSWVTFVDDDDSVAPDFLRAMLDAAAPGLVVAAPVHEVSQGSTRGQAEGYIARALGRVEGRTLPVSEVAAVCAYNAAKLVDLETARSARYDASLRSGEDHVYWLSIFAARPFRVRVLPGEPSTAYVRTVRSQGVGRQAAGFDFEVTQRLECIAALQRVDQGEPEVRLVADRLRRWQAQWVNRYLRRHPDERGRVVEAAERAGAHDVPWEVVNRGLARSLAVCYCFPPDLDTSGMVAAKRLREGGEATDVISVDMGPARPHDPRALQVVGPALGRHHIVRGPMSFYSWPPAAHFVEQTLARFERWDADPDSPRYERLYSRAMAVSAHVAAAMVKVRRPELEWTAEFSDPLRYDTLGQERAAEIHDDATGRQVLAALADAGYAVPRSRYLFDVAERLAYALADKVVFTNEHQRDFMLGYCEGDPALVERARVHSEVWPHPVPADELYEVGRPEVALEPDRVHLAYFGVFYGTRDLTVLLDALERLDAREQARFALHVFTPKPHELGVQAARRGLADVVRARPYVGYFDYLALTRRFDVLLVNDAATGDHHPLNPYVPSKMADYTGSGTPIWVVYEPGSVLSRLPAAHRSALGDTDAAEAVLRELLTESRVTFPIPDISGLVSR